MRMFVVLAASVVVIVLGIPSLFVHGLAASTRPITPHRILVIGKFTIDEYHAPNDDAAVVSVGGGPIMMPNRWNCAKATAN